MFIASEALCPSASARMKATDVLLRTTLFVLVLISSNIQAAPSSDLRPYLNERDNESLSNWLLRNIVDFRRDRRAEMDAGFLSRHSALKNFMNSYNAAIEASDPYGPGRKK